MDQFEQQEPGQEAGSLHKHIFGVAKIAGIAAIVSLAGTLVGVVAALLKPAPAVPEAAAEGFDEEAMQQFAQVGGYISAIIGLTIGILVFYFLFRFSSQAQAAVRENDQPKLAIALHNLSRYFKVWGVIMMVIIAIFALSLLGGVLGSAFGG